MLRELIVKIGLESIDTQEEIIVEILLDGGVARLVISLEFTRKQEFKLKKNPIYIKNADGSFNKKGSIEHMVEIKIYYQVYRERIEIDVIRG